jgi:putative transposase
VLHADNSVTGADVRRIVAQVIGRRGPTRVRSHNGTEFICEALVNWLPSKGAKSIPLTAEIPFEDAELKDSHISLPDEFLEFVEFEDVADARARAYWHRLAYSAVRTHSSLGHATPQESSAAHGRNSVIVRVKYLNIIVVNGL